MILDLTCDLRGMAFWAAILVWSRYAVVWGIIATGSEYPSSSIFQMTEIETPIAKTYFVSFLPETKLWFVFNVLEENMVGPEKGPVGFSELLYWYSGKWLTEHALNACGTLQCRNFLWAMLICHHVFILSISFDHWETVHFEKSIKICCSAEGVCCMVIESRCSAQK